MDNLRAVIKNLFCYISPQEILKGNIVYDNVNRDTFLKLGNGYISQYTNDEIRNMYDYLKNEFSWQSHRLKGTLPRKREPNLNVFDALMAFDYSVLLEINGEPVCQYQHLLRWRDMITVLEEDLFHASFLAMQDVLEDKKRYHFFWKPVVGHNNFALNKLVSRGVAENHFHLKGSAPLFHLSWLSIMNDVNNETFVDVLQKYDSNKLQQPINYNINYTRGSLVTMWRQATVIRLFLFTILQNDYIDFGHTYVNVEDMLKYCEREQQEKLLNELKKDGIDKSDFRALILLENYQQLLDTESILAIKKKYCKRMVKRLLEDDELLEENVTIIQSNIERMQDLYGKSPYDYMLFEKWLVNNPDEGKNEIISGERWFMYEMFMHVYKKEKEWEPYINWFYLYLVLKANIRTELVQANTLVGFDNFKIYQDRKEELIENTIYEPAYVRMAVRDTILNQHITSLEARISPKSTKAKLQNSIQKYDNWVCEGVQDEKKAKKLRDKYFYVIHFVKGIDTTKKDNTWDENCRHYEKRQEVEEQAKAIAAVREEGAAESARIKGIDACSAEIGCRPEVFAHAFRFLKNHTAPQQFRNGLVQEGIIKNDMLMVTYHVGEDFLDIIDGLRAIDETILFHNLKCGDRLGHALALGIDIEEWYESKANRILISRQDYMDNLVWLYAKIRKYNIEGCEDAQVYIEKRFSEYFEEIYMNNFSSKEYETICDKAREFFDREDVIHGYNHKHISFGMNEYYDAWKLRGDDPELYKDGFFRIKHDSLETWDLYSINHEYPQNYRVRYNPEVAVLYYMYHYNEGVIKSGSQIVEIKIKPCIIRSVKKVREIMQQEIARMGIGIETNPSSNYLIGTFRRYDKHPITNWYNVGLTYDCELLKKCPQIQVSINTDDQGVFSTYIENEYAYLALALEKSKDENGKFVYNRTFILQWLDNIRRMGIDQSFGNPAAHISDTYGADDETDDEMYGLLY